MTFEEQIAAFQAAMDEFKAVAIAQGQAIMTAFMPFVQAWEQAHRQPLIDRRALSRRRSRRRTERKMKRW